MKIAVSSTGPTVDHDLDARFGRAAQFLIIDLSTDEVVVLDNAQNLEAPQGAGIQAAKLVMDADAEVVITGHCGPKAFQTLRAAGIKVVVGAEGAVKDVVERFKAGRLEPADAPDVEGHWA
jgi:predicted Fe-Mo cluster-binding NifX family protein